MLQHLIMKFQIKTALFALSTFIHISALVTLALFLYQISQTEQQVVEGELKYKTGKLVQVLEDRFRQATHELQVLSNSRSAKEGDWKMLYLEANKVVSENPNFAAITLVDHHNNLNFVTTIPYGKPTFETNYKELVQQAIRTGKPNISGAFRVPIIDGQKIAISFPFRTVYGENRVLRAILNVEYFRELVSEQDLSPDWISTILDRNGVIVIQSGGENKGSDNTDIDLKAFSKISSLKLLKYKNKENEDFTGFAQALYGYNWLISIAAKDADLNQKHHKKILIFFIFGALLIILSLSLTNKISNLISQEAKELAQDITVDKDELRLNRPRHIIEFDEIFQCIQKILEQKKHTAVKLIETNEEKEAIRDLYEYAPCGYHSLAPDGSILRINDTELKWLGYERDEVINKNFINFVAEESKKIFEINFPKFLKNGSINNIEFDLIRKNKSRLPVSISATLIRSPEGQPIMSRSIVVDISERRAFEKRLLELSTRDALTGLSNRRHFYDLANQAINVSSRDNTSLAIAILDIDHFKKINDTYGHHTGDVVLKTLSDKTKSFLRAGDIFARIGGEEFAIILPKLSAESAASVLIRLKDSISALSIKTAENEIIKISISVGLTEKFENEKDIDLMMKRADVALYRSKGEGRNRVSIE